MGSGLGRMLVTPLIASLLLLGGHIVYTEVCKSNMNLPLPPSTPPKSVIGISRAIHDYALQGKLEPGFLMLATKITITCNYLSTDQLSAANGQLLGVNW